MQVIVLPATVSAQLRQEARHPSIGNRSGELTVPHHSRHVQRLHHHAATRLGYRRRRLVMIVIPNIDHPSMKSPSPGVQPLAPSEHTAIVPTPTSTPMVGPGFTGGACWPSSMQKQANQVPAVRLTVTSRMDPCNLRCSTIATRPIFGRITTLSSTRTVSGPLSARNPCSCFRRLNLGNPMRRPDRWPAFTRLRCAPQLSAACPKSMIRVLGGVLAQHRTPRRDDALDHIPARPQRLVGQPLANVQTGLELTHGPVVGEPRIAGVLAEQRLLLRCGLERQTMRPLHRTSPDWLALAQIAANS